MALKKKDKVSGINRVKKKLRSSSSTKRSLKEKVKRRTLKRIENEMAELRAETNSVKEGQATMLTVLDNLGSDIAHSREVNKHVIRHNNRSQQLLDLMLAGIITGSGTLP